MIAYCGISCTECPAYIATKNDDPEGRNKIARRWSQDFQLNMSPEDLVCDGCLLVGKRLCVQCMVCKIRKCAMAKTLQSCAFCTDYPCAELGKLLAVLPDAQARLDRIRQEGMVSPEPE